MTDNTPDWISQLASCCLKINSEYLYVILDQAGLNCAIIPALEQLSLEWESLWKGLPEEIAESSAPLLIRIYLNNVQQRLWIEGICHQATAKHAVLTLSSLWSMKSLAHWLQCCSDASHEGRAGILRFYDPRLFPLLIGGILNAEQVQQLHRPALFWSWVDRDGKPTFVSGNGNVLGDNEKMSRIDLTDAQFEYLMCVCDVNILRTYQDLGKTHQLSEESLFQLCYQGMREASDKGMIMDEERNQWVLNKISRLGCSS